MAFARSLPTVARDPGRYEAVPLGTSETTRQVLVRLNAATDVWEVPGAVTLFGLERSFDGGATWEHWVSGNPPYRRDKNGDPPSIGIKGDFSGVRVRPFIVYGSRSAIGIDAEVR